MHLDIFAFAAIQKIKIKKIKKLFREKLRKIRFKSDYTRRRKRSRREERKKPGLKSRVKKKNEDYYYTTQFVQVVSKLF